MKLNLKVYESRGVVGIIAIEEGGLHRTADITIPKDQFDVLTIGQFKSKLPDYWPKLSSTGFVKQQIGDDKMFLDNVVMKDVPIVYGLDGHTLSYQLEWGVLEGSKTEEVTIDAAPVSPRRAPAPAPARAVSATALGVPETDKLYVHDGSQVHLSFVGTTSAGWRKHKDITISSSEFGLLKVSDFKKRLGDGWPDWGRGGFTPSGDKFLDLKTLHDIGLHPLPNGKTSTHEFILRIYGTTTLPPSSPNPDTKEKHSTSSDSHQPLRGQSAGRVNLGEPPAEPAYVPAYQRQAVQTVASTAPLSPRKMNSTAVDPLEFELSIRMYQNSTGRVLAINGRSKPNFNHSDQISIPNERYMDFTFKDLKNALPDNWPALQPGGTIISSTYITFSDSDTLFSKGLRGGRVNTEDYELVFKKSLDQTKKAPHAPQSTQGSGEKKESDIPVKLRLPVELRMYMNGSSISIIARSENPDIYQFSELTFTGYEWNGMDIKKFKDVLGSKEWPGCTSGAFFRHKYHEDNEMMVNLGIRAYQSGTESYHILFEVNPNAKPVAHVGSTTATSSSPAEVNEPAYVPSYQRVSAASSKTDVAKYKTPSPLDFAMSIRIFVNSNSRVLAINGRAKPNFNHSEQLTIGIDEFVDYTFGSFKKALPATWPKLEEGGVIVSTQYVPFDDTDTLLSKGLKGNRVTTEDYELSFHMLPNQPGNTTASSVAASTAVAKQESDYSKSQLLTVELRMYLSGGKVNIIARSEHPDFYKYTELAFPESEWDSMNFKSFKEALKQKEWPSLSAGAFFRTQYHADNEKLADLGIKGFRSGTDAHHVTFVLDPANDIEVQEPIKPSATRRISGTRPAALTAGARLCPKCRHPAAATVKFCGSCGAKIDVPATTTTTSTTATVKPIPLTSPSEPAYIPAYQRHAQEQQPPVSPRTAGTASMDPNEFVLSVRMFINNTHRVMGLTGKTQNFYKSDQLSVPSNIYSNFTFGQFKESLPATWPKFQPGGIYKGQAFRDDETMLSRGIRGNRVNEEDFELRFKVACTGAASGSITSSATKSENDFPASKRLPMEIRVYQTPGTVNAIVRSQNPDIYQFTELTIPVDKFSALTLKEWKDLLANKEWPGFATGGFFLQNWREDSEKLSDIGIKSFPGGGSELYILTCILK